ncbi:OmpA family protein [Dyadobacter arcticus]|uniref:Outer membrane protein OmpA-like peptidoglycan-associated protein n=1 Tax=Dyadobacter arcticus TaxID=1078754 RepID=A0ABX0USU7_9BACT|nr:OmpA family protein [Dyadobacter arcticus]NIJ54999.1 outer membrane protein OmpA-like peptidoglycan-associated protein [Dyadobacter arcticus]
MQRVLYILCFLVFTTSFFATAQDATLSRKGRETYEKAQKAWQDRKLPEAITLFQNVLEQEPNSYDVNLRLAQIYELQRNTDLTKKYYSKAIQLRPTSPQSGPAFQWMGKHYFEAERYDSAQVYFQKAFPLFPAKSSLSRLAEKSIASSRFAQEAIKNPLKIEKRSLGDTVNFLGTQYFPVLTADDETLIFTGLTENRDENIYITQRKKGGRATSGRVTLGWEKPQEISASINTTNNEGTCSVSADGRTLVFTACNRQDGYGSCDLYISQKDGKDWSAPVNLGDQVNSREWESQPSLSADGHILYFASDRKGGQGRRDIWVTSLNEKKQWTSPKNLGAIINTTDDENAPFIHANGRTLFYASNGLPGMGGFDIFIAQRVDTVWSAPRNIGYPLNTVSDQVGLFIASDGEKAYYTDDNSDKGKGRSLLYTFAVPATLQEMIVPTRYAKGKIFDKKTGAALASDIDLFDLKTQQKVGAFTSDSKTGTFLAVLNSGGEYAFYVSKNGYLFKSLSFAVSDTASFVNLDIPLEAIEKDRAEVLNNIFFQTGKFDLDDKSKVELDKMADFLNRNKAIKIEISGHTDDVGSDSENLELSKRRAQSVQQYLHKSGIGDERIVAKGYGETKPVAPNDSELSRQKNRRIEWRIL